MRFLLVALLVPGLALGAARKPVVAFLPPSGATPELASLGLLVELRASELLEPSGKYTELHVKQATAMAEQEQLDLARLGDAKPLARARAALGADRLVTVGVESTPKGLVVKGAVYDGPKAAGFSTAPAASWPEALTLGSETLARQLGQAEGVALPKKPQAQPESANDEALKALGRCTATVFRQPMGVETPSVLDAAELEGAIAACRKAVELDPGLRFGAALLGLAQAILGDDAAAAKTLGALGDADDVLEAYSLARFWMLTRYQSNEAGVALLKDVVARHPGELLLRAYLGETLDLLGRHQEAVAAWKDYLALAPASTYAQGHLGKTLARLGRHDEAIAAAKKALALDPEGVEASLQLGSRYIDAQKYKEAIGSLQPLATDKARGEVLLRLGWAQWLSGNVDAAATLFQQALDRATAPGEWRTRGRAFYNLALVEAKKGRPEAARVSLKASMQTGFRVRQVDPLLADVARELERGAFAGPAPVVDAGAVAAVPSKPLMLPRETSLLPVDAFGEVDLKAKKPPPPEGLVLYRF